MTHTPEAPPPRRDDPLRLATPPLDDLESRRARAAIEGRLFTSAPQAHIHLGRYRVVKPIGTGGMGVVYRAYDPQLERDVAVKLMHPRVQDGDTARARLLREARAMARVAHPNVIHVYDVGTVDDNVFIAMELVEGQPLSSWLDAGPHPWHEVLEHFVAAGQGLAAAHAAGVIHRDFKPENVLLGQDGRVRVGDFGLAGFPAIPESTPAEAKKSNHQEKSSPISDSLTQTGTFLGTPKYVAPEQEVGATATDKSDQFSFCVAAYEALYGHPPFPGTTVAAYRTAVHAGEVVPVPRDTSVPGWIHRALLRGLAQNPDDRHPSMDALLSALSQDPRNRPRRRRLVPMVLPALAIAAVGVWTLTRPPDASRPSAPTSAPVAAVDPKGDSPGDRAPRSSLPTASPLPDKPPNTPLERPSPDAPATEPPSQPVATPTVSADRPTPTAHPPTPTTPPVPRVKRCYLRESDDSLIRTTRGKHTPTLRDSHGTCYSCAYRAPEAKLPGLNPADCTEYWLCTKESAQTCTS